MTETAKALLSIPKMQPLFMASGHSVVAAPLCVRVTGQQKHLFQPKKSFCERGPHWSKRTFMLVRKNLYRSLPGTCISSLGGTSLSADSIGQRKPLFCSKTAFHVSTSSLHSQFRWLSPSLEVHIGQKHIFVSQKNIFHVRQILSEYTSELPAFGNLW